MSLISTDCCRLKLDTTASSYKRSKIAELLPIQEIIRLVYDDSLFRATLYRP